MAGMTIKKNRKALIWGASWTIALVFTYVSARLVIRPILIGFQRFGGESLRSEATGALVQQGLHPRHASAALLRGLKDKNKNIRYQAARLLGRKEFGSREVIGALIAALGDSDQSVRSAACYSLGHIGPQAKEAVPAIVKTLRDELDAGYIDPNYVVMGAVFALGEMGPASSEALTLLADILEDWQGFGLLPRNVVETLGKIDQPAVPILVKAAAHESWDVRSATSRVFREKALSGEGVTEALKRLFQEKDDYIHRNATLALARVAPETLGIVPALEEIEQKLKERPQSKSTVFGFKEMNLKELAEVQDALKKLRTYRAEKGIDEERILARIRDLKSNDPKIRLAAARELGTMRPLPKDAIQSLIEELADREYDPRDAASETLVKFGADAIPGLVSAMHDQDYWVRATAAQTLGMLGKAEKRVLTILFLAIEKDYGPVQAAAIKALGKLRPTNERVISRLIDLLSHKDWPIRSSACTAIQYLGPLARAAVPALSQALKDEEHAVRSSASYALREFGPAANDAVPALIATIEDKSNRHEIRWNAAEALKKIGSPEASAAYQLFRQEEHNNFENDRKTNK